MIVSLQTGVEGTWRLRFNDVFGEDWVTNPIAFNVTCTDLVAELEAIPNDVIDEGTVLCLHKHDEVNPDLWTKYMLRFTGNPGVHKIPEILVLDESGRHTLKKTGADAYAGLDIAVVYDTGITGEFYDFFMQKCGVVIGVTDFVTTVADDYEHYGLVQTTSMSSGTLRTLKECLGDSNGVSTDNVGVENWDFGGPTGHFGPWHPTILEAVPGQFPHLVKLVNNAAESEFEGGMYTIMTWHQENDNFVLSAAVDSSMEYQVRSWSDYGIPCPLYVRPTLCLSDTLIPHIRHPSFVWKHGHRLSMSTEDHGLPPSPTPPLFTPITRTCQRPENTYILIPRPGGNCGRYHGCHPNFPYDNKTP